ncbi:MAG: flagellar protein export ATPase FliI [Candidatus Margulisbacteria bacterium]|nr:flagellar protein export ATPase FliI [Candidatus Margulisiibacteriota bacterium]
MELEFQKYYRIVETTDTCKIIGKVIKVIGLVIEAQVPGVSVGELCTIYCEGDNPHTVEGEVVGFREGRVLLMPLGTTSGISPGSRILATGHVLRVPVGPQLLGRVLNGLGEPIDGKGVIIPDAFYPLDRNPPDPTKRPRINKKLATSVKAIDGLLTLGQGQRIGIFSGSGVGKSTLMGMVARGTEAEIAVIALIGERGREVRDFIEESLGEEGLKKAVVICATSDQPPMIRLKGALVGTAIAEYFRDQGKKVMFMMDSVTRFAMAQREVGLATGEPPTTKGYTPSVFALIPRLMERSGTSEAGTITGVYTVLVEGSDMDEPIADTCRSILDGHIVLSRDIAAKNHYPSIDIGPSVSRLMPVVASPQHREAAGKLREVLARYNEAEDLVNIGAYVRGSNPKIDEALEKIDAVNEFLCQKTEEKFEFDETVAMLQNLFA